MKAGIDEGLCNRCLAIVNVGTYVAAHYGNNCEIFQDVTDPVGLQKWVQEQIHNNNATLSLDSMPRAFVAISTWHGDPVCPGHLQILMIDEHRQRERGWRA